MGTKVNKSLLFCQDSRASERLADTEDEDCDDAADPDYGVSLSKRKAEPLRDGKLGVSIQRQVG